MGNNSEYIEKFLNKMLDASRLGIMISPKMICSNLTTIGICYSDSRDISKYFNTWIDNYKDNEDIVVYNDPSNSYYCWFKSPGNIEPNTEHMIKMYIPIDDVHIDDGVKKIFDFIADNKIVHTSKVASEVRNDDIVIRVFSMDDALKIQNFVMNDDYLKEGIMKPNPFTFSNDFISYAWDGHISCSLMISEYISGYINSIKNTKEKATYKGFLAFVTNVYNKAFVDGVDPLRYIEIDETSFKYLDDYKRATEMLLMALTSEDKDVDDFNYNYNKIIQGKDIKNKKNISECQGIFERIYMALVSKYGYKETDERLLSFMYTGDYRFFTKKYNIRASIMDNKITPEVMALLVTGMKEKQEKERMLLRGLKKTYKKYDEEKNDYKQVRFALENAFYGNFSYFTNENNCRTALKNSVNKDEIYGLIAFKLLGFGYPIEDVYIGTKALSELYLTEIFNKESYKSIGGK